MVKAGGDVNKLNNRGGTSFTLLVDLLPRNLSGDGSLIETLRFLIEYTNVNLNDANKRNLLSSILVPDKVSNKEYFYKIFLKHVAKLNALDLLINPNLINTIFHSSIYSGIF